MSIYNCFITRQLQLMMQNSSLTGCQLQLMEQNDGSKCCPPRRTARNWLLKHRPSRRTVKNCHRKHRPSGRTDKKCTPADYPSGRTLKKSIEKTVRLDGQRKKCSGTLSVWTDGKTKYNYKKKKRYLVFRDTL